MDVRLDPSLRAEGSALGSNTHIFVDEQTCGQSQARHAGSAAFKHENDHSAESCLLLPWAQSCRACFLNELGLCHGGRCTVGVTGHSLDPLPLLSACH